MVINYLLLPRTIVEIKGTHASRLLQGLITQDIEQVKLKGSLPSLILNSKGRYLLDFFIIYHNNSFFIDISSSDVELLLSTLNYYKLRLDVTMEIKSNLKVYALFQHPSPYYPKAINPVVSSSTIIIEDNRLPTKLGLRVITNNDNFFKETIISSTIANYFEDKNYSLNLTTLEKYNEMRYNWVVPQQQELVKEKSIPLEANLDELNFISFTKGCYLGQEFTNASKRILVIRKRLVVFKSTTNYNSSSLLKTAVITNDSNETIGKVIGIQNNYLMALTKIESFTKQSQYFFNNYEINLCLPQWLDNILRK